MVESYTQDLTEWFVYLMCQDLEDIVYKDQHLVGGKQLKKFVYTFFICIFWSNDLKDKKNMFWNIYFCMLHKWYKKCVMWYIKYMKNICAVFFCEENSFY